MAPAGTDLPQPPVGFHGALGEVSGGRDEYTRAPLKQLLATWVDVGTPECGASHFHGLWATDQKHHRTLEAPGPCRQLVGNCLLRIHQTVQIIAVPSLEHCAGWVSAPARCGLGPPRWRLRGGPPAAHLQPHQTEGQYSRPWNQNFRHAWDHSLGGRPQWVAGRFHLAWASAMF